MLSRWFFVAFRLLPSPLGVSSLVAVAEASLGRDSDRERVFVMQRVCTPGFVVVLRPDDVWASSWRAACVRRWSRLWRLTSRCSGRGYPLAAFLGVPSAPLSLVVMLQLDD